MASCGLFLFGGFLTDFTPAPMTSVPQGAVEHSCDGTLPAANDFGGSSPEEQSLDTSLDRGCGHGRFGDAWRFCRSSNRPTG